LINLDHTGERNQNKKIENPSLPSEHDSPLFILKSSQKPVEMAAMETIVAGPALQDPGMGRVRSIRARFEQNDTKAERQQLRRGLEFEWHLVQHQIHQLEAKLLTANRESELQREQWGKIVNNRETAQAKRAAILEERRLKAEAEAAKRAKPCTACMEDIDSNTMLLLECDHWFCRNCING
jgi:hypothetical protein